MPKNAKIFNCHLCDFQSCKKSNFEKHLSTGKHNSRAILNAFEQKKCQKCLTYICQNCNKIYKNRNSLWYHEQKCLGQSEQTIINSSQSNSSNFIQSEQSISDSNQSNQNDIIIEEKCILTTNNDLQITPQFFFELLKQNSEFKELIIEQNKQLIELSKEKSMNNCHNNNTTNNTNNFNLQFFLNETCKDALNIDDFVNQIPLYLTDLEETARLGYVEGISRIFLRGLKELEVNQRPIHCSDAKRETLYIKDGNKWEKEDDNKTKLTKAIKQVAQKNIKQISQWVKEHPNCCKSDSKKNDLYLKIVSNSMSGSSDEEAYSNYNKIVKNITKQVIINKHYNY
jgi:hypothetical protein